MRSNLESVLQEAGVGAETLAPLTEGRSDGIYTLAVSGAEGISLWRRLRALVSQTGHWPVLLGGEDDLKRHRERRKHANKRTSAEIVRQGLSLDIETWLAARRAEWDDEDEDAGLNNFRGEWPQGEQASDTFVVPQDFTGSDKPPLFLGLIPTAHGWEVPVSLQIGGWNECPFPKVHVALMKYWADRYGAELVCVTHDIVEMQVLRPPSTREAALQLAAEQLFYCEDIVTQGTETLERLAATLLNGTVWYFWWD